jgi:HEAT repeats/Putative zinc-finger
MQEQGGEEIKLGACEEFDSRRMLFAAGELDPEEMAEVNEHLQQCEACTAAMARDSEVLRAMSDRHTEPDAALLATCRANLVDALDRQEEGGWVRRALGSFVPTSWLAPRPAFSAAMLLVLGFSVGLFGPKMLKHQAAPAAIEPPPMTATNASDPGLVEAKPTVTGQSVDSNTPLSKIDLHSAEVAGINVFPAGPSDPPQVQVNLRTEQPMTISGSVNDANVKRVLINVLRNNQRFDPDLRLDAVDLLRVRSDDPDVRAALCQAVHTDQNAAVRLKALEALSDSSGPQDQVRQTLLDALESDQNPGVRVEAMNSLRDLAESGKIDSDSKLINVLRAHMQKDPNNYIRLQSAATLRDLAPSSKF